MIAENFILTELKNIKLYAFSEFQGFPEVTAPLQMQAVDVALAVVQKGSIVYNQIANDSSLLFIRCVIHLVLEIYKEDGITEI